MECESAKLTVRYSAPGKIVGRVPANTDFSFSTESQNCQRMGGNWRSSVARTDLSDSHLAHLPELSCGLAADRSSNSRSENTVRLNSSSSFGSSPALDIIFVSSRKSSRMREISLMTSLRARKPSTHRLDKALISFRHGSRHLAQLRRRIHWSEGTLFDIWATAQPLDLALAAAVPLQSCRPAPGLRSRCGEARRWRGLRSRGCSGIRRPSKY